MLVTSFIPVAWVGLTVSRAKKNEAIDHGGFQAQDRKRALATLGPVLRNHPEYCFLPEFSFFSFSFLLFLLPFGMRQLVKN